MRLSRTVAKCSSLTICIAAHTSLSNSLPMSMFLYVMCKMRRGRFDSWGRRGRSRACTSSRVGSKKTLSSKRGRKTPCTAIPRPISVSHEFFQIRQCNHSVVNQQLDGVQLKRRRVLGVKTSEPTNTKDWERVGDTAESPLADARSEMAAPVSTLHVT